MFNNKKKRKMPRNKNRCGSSTKIIKHNYNLKYRKIKR